MLSSDRNLTLITIICIFIIGLAIAVRVNDLTQSPKTLKNDWTAQGVSPDAISTNDQSFYAESPDPSPAVDSSRSSLDDVTAAAYLVGNVVTGRVYLEKNSHSALPIASMSKLMTALVALEKLSANQKITITEPMTMVFPDGSRLYAGETFRARDLLYPLLLNSSNVAAEALASSTNRIEFLNMMNEYAWEIGLPQSFFADPSGLNPLNAASSRGFFELAQYLYRARQDLLALTRVAKTSVATTSDHGAHDFTNIHPYVNDSRFIGGKTGRTDQAGETMLTILRIKNQPVAFIVLGSRVGRRGPDTQILVNEIERILSESGRE